MEYYSSHRLGCFVSTMTLRQWDLALPREGRVSNHHAFCYQSSPLFGLLKGSHQIPHSSMITFCSHLWPRHCGRMSQDSLSHDCLFSSPLSQKISPFSRWYLSIALKNEGSNRMSFFANFLHCSSHCLTQSHVGFRLAGGVELSCSLNCQAVTRTILLTLWLCL
jgi:hypothetical protein